MSLPSGKHYSFSELLILGTSYKRLSSLILSGLIHVVAFIKITIFLNGGIIFHCLSICLLVNTWVVFTFCLFEPLLSILNGYIPRREILDTYGRSLIAKLSHLGCTILHFFQQCTRVLHLHEHRFSEFF